MALKPTSLNPVKSKEEILEEPKRKRAAAANGKKTYPWQDEDVQRLAGKGLLAPKNYTIRLDHITHQKLKWLAESSGASMNKIINAAIEAEISHRLKAEGVPDSALKGDHHAK